MGIIHLLDNQTVLKIAAGEVIDRPASVVRELIDNALDAHATEIEVSLVDGGITSIEVTDNGNGMEPDDLAICYHKHTTSKISRFEDLENLSSLGFRGEALASIASVATLDIMSRTKESLSGYRLVVCYGDARPLQEVGMGYGTIVRVTELFERTPARKKFLQSPIQESKLVFKELIKKMLVFPECGFSYRSDGREKFRTPPRNTHLERIIDLFGDISEDVIPFSFETDHAHIQGFLGNPTLLKPQRNMQFFSVNRRIVEWKSFPFVISQVYGNLIPTQKHPVVFVFVEMDASEVDVNVHPMKKEVRFRQERKFQEALWQGMQKALQKTLMGSFSPSRSVSSFDSSYLSQNASPSWVVRESPSEEKTYSSSYPEPDFFPQDLESSSKEDSSQLSLQESFLSFHDYRYAGELFATYLLFEKEDEVIIIDQHAAHERICYEEIKQAIQEKYPSQELFYPISLVLSSDQYEEVFSHQDIFQSLGFEIEPFGGTTILLRSIPAILSPNAAQEAFEACLAAIENGKSFDSFSLIDEAIKQMACKTAVKANERLPSEQIQALLHTLRETPNSTSCPHGRPTILRLSKKDLEKLFKRTGF